LLFLLLSVSDWYYSMIKAWYRKRTLYFLKPAGTSRGILHQKPSWFLFLADDESPEIKGIGECSLVPGLSRETEAAVDHKIDELCRVIQQGGMAMVPDLSAFPSLAFGLETALLDLANGGKRELFASDFTKGKSSIRINGLIWIGSVKSMLEQVEEKLNDGFRCLKFKIGSLQLEEELQLLRLVRSRFNAGDLEIRADANGAFETNAALEILKRLAELEIHSVEQPVRPGQWEEMARICMNSPIPIALDEELLGRPAEEEKQSLITAIRPQFLIIKPGLLGGFQQAETYIKLAKQENIGWWITSALESNIGLNAIAQWTYTLSNSLAQGLGTGKLYRDNVLCPLNLKGENMFYRPSRTWDLSFIES
jgi:O-succinylbenzoate synthase